TNTALAGPYKLNQNVTYTVVANNNGPDDATGVKVDYHLPAQLQFVSSNSANYDSGTGIWAVGNLANGNSITLVITAKILNTGAINTIAIVSGNESDPDHSNDTA